MVQRSRHILMVFLWNLHLEIGNKITLLTKSRKQMSSGVVRRCFDVAVGADLRSRPFAREELLAMTTQARLMFGKLSHIRKRLGLARLFPVLRRKCVTRTARRAVLLG